uniref:TF-B3 domain-containing protein n=1 Tax=Kalanchoe fedtschenkoi TaxID=63787 RepID=A0A7N1A7H8_KALFE
MKFFRIVTADITTRSKLKLPRRFGERCGAKVPGNVRLQVPTGATWRVEVKKNSNGVWLGEGWFKFAESLGVKYGHFLVFDYDAVRAVFHVVAIGMSAVETEYPTVSSIDDDDDQSGRNPRLSNLKRRKIEKDDDDDDDDVVILKDDANLGRSKPQKCQAPGKKAKASKCEVDQSMCGNGSVRSDDGDLTTTKKRGKFEREIILNRERMIQCIVQGRGRNNRANDQAEKAIERAKSFKADEPVCIIALSPCYVTRESPDGTARECQLLVPMPFIEAYFNLKIKDATLRTDDGRKWSVKYRLARYRPRSYFTSGWTQFVRDNGLKAGDVCLFELIRGAENAIKVVIFRAISEDEAVK